MAYAGGKRTCMFSDHLFQTDATSRNCTFNSCPLHQKVIEMYSVNRITHERYGSVVQIERVENGRLATPFQAVNAAMKERRLWLESGIKKIRILVDDKVMSPKQAEHWAHEEYISLPKCEGCAKILDGDVHTHQFSGTKFFCSAPCADRDYLEEIEKQKDEEEIDYL